MFAFSLVRLADVPPPPQDVQDGRSRWVYLAAILGLFVGGFIAYKRRNA